MNGRGSERHIPFIRFFLNFMTGGYRIRPFSRRAYLEEHNQKEVRGGRVDWVLFSTALSITLLGYVTLFPNTHHIPDSLYKQAIIILISCAAFFVATRMTFFFRALFQTGGMLFFLYLFSMAVLVSLLLFAEPLNGARSWFVFGSFSVQPVDFVKIVLIAALARYFAARHIYIRHIAHIAISAALIALPIVLVLAQPDLGSAVILGTTWFLLILFLGIRSKHFLLLLLVLVSIGAAGWLFFLADYQKDRVRSFLEPLTDLQGVGYNAYQAKVAIGSGGIFGKGVSEGTQSKLSFLPEYSSDFIFAAFAEEWGFIGVVLLFFLFGVLLFHLLALARQSPSTVDALFIIGTVIWFYTHLFYHIGVNIGLLPVTGVTMVFMSQGGSHLFASFLALGIISGMTRRNVHTGSP